MNILNLIDSYVEIKVKSEKLKFQIEICENYLNLASKDIIEAIGRKNYVEAKRKTDCAKSYQDMINEDTEEYNQLDKNLKTISQTFLDIISTTATPKLESIASIISNKKASLTEQANFLAHKERLAELQSAEASRFNRYEEAEKNDNLGSSYRKEIDKIEQSIACYKTFENILSLQINERVQGPTK